MAYLYGSAIQGIQGFIFETNKLKEIVGASEIVEHLSYERFKERFDLDEEVFIMHAAGNIKLVLQDREKLAEIVRHWPMLVEEEAPGLTLSQAVVPLNGELSHEHIRELEKKLQTQRNKGGSMRPLAIMAMERSRRTGQPVVDWRDESDPKNRIPRDLAVRARQEAVGKSALNSLMDKCFSNERTQTVKNLPLDVSDIIGKGESGWLAVVHADGNGLGRLIQSMAAEMSQRPSEIRNLFRAFSQALDASTISAMRATVEEVILPEMETDEKKADKNEKLPFRPVLLGGDDLTIIIRADLALDFTTAFLTHFESETRREMETLGQRYDLSALKNGLTACAGIAFMKDSYPFHYAVELADSLCADAKKGSRNASEERMPSSLAFHKIQDSFVEDYEDIVSRELTAGKVSFKYGPYGLTGEELPKVDTLKNQAELVLKKDAPHSGLRNWLALLHDDPTRAQLWMERVCEITTKESEKYVKELHLDCSIQDGKTHLYDVLSLASMLRGVKKGGKKDD